MDSQEMTVMKDAARRLQSFFADRNIRVQHAVCLEALSSSLGARNWRTLRDKLDSPTVVVEDTLNSRRWLVRGLYSDKTEYAEAFAGTCAQDAAIKALYEQLQANHQIMVHAVRHLPSNDLVETEGLHCRDLRAHGELVLSLIPALLQRQLQERPGPIGQVVDCEVLQAIVDVLQENASEKKLVDQLDMFTYKMPSLSSYARNAIGFEAKSGAFYTLTVTSALEAIEQALRQVEKELTRQERTDLYQFSALLECYLEDVAAIITTYLACG